MRTVAVVTLDPGRDARVQELRVRDVRRILALATPEQLARPVPELVREHLPELLDLLGETLALPAGECVDDLSLSDCEAIGRAWWEMHARFFAPLAGLARQALAAGLVSPTAMPGSSTAPVSPASSADTATSGTTAGPSI